MSVKMTVLLALLVLTSLILAPGMIWVEVQEHQHDGVHLWLPVPVSFVQLGVAFVPDKELAPAARELRPHLPLVKVVCEELERLPDAVFVEVHDGDDHVTVAKRGRSFAIDVDSRDETVHVSFPISAVSSIVERIARAQAVNDAQAVPEKVAGLSVESRRSRRGYSASPRSLHSGR